MVINSSGSPSSHQLDPSVLKWFEVTSNASLLVAGTIAAIILSGWFVPSISSVLPDGWALMQATSALSVLLLSIALLLKKQKNNYRFQSASQFFVISSIFLVGVTLLEHWYGQESILGRYLVAKKLLPMVYPTSIQSASCFLILALSLLIDHTRQGRLGYLLDALIMILVILNLLYLAGYIYKASHFIKETSVILISPQTLVCIALLTFVQAARRSPFGSYSTVLLKGIAGHTARIVLPSSVVISYVIILSQTLLAKSGIVNSPYDAAMTAVALSTILIIVVIMLARKIDFFERRLRNASITDELTGAYNLRGLFLHGKQALLDAKRSTVPLTVLFIDADGLKNVNDSLGHDAGSQLLCDIVTLMRNNFRDSDIISRVGGDEFVVIAHSQEDEIVPAVQRLNKAADGINTSGNKPYKIGFSIGKVMFDPHSTESLEDLLSRADAAMYQNKKERRNLKGR